MYAPEIIGDRRERAERFLDETARATYDLSIEDHRALTGQILHAVDEQGALTRKYTPEELGFMAMARVRVGYDVPWYLETFVYIDEEGHGLRPLYPLWDSQTFVMARLAALERKQQALQSPDGLLLNILKVRQVGISTLGMALVSHRILTQNYIRSIAGSDTEEQAKYLFRMVERIYEYLPFFLKPGKVVPYNAGRELNFDTFSSIKTAWGKSTRGALQEVGGKKGNIERGRTNSVVHISELATWDNPEQLDTSLLPGIPFSPKVLVLFESTAETAGDWWHRHWLASEEGHGRFQNQFIPWPVKYRMEPPPDWQPSPDTLAVAAAIERDSPTWMAGETLHLDIGHLYWYETTRGYYASKNQLHDFFKEYPSNPEECFQYAGRSVFSLDELSRIDQAARKVIDVWAVEPSREIASLRRMPESTGDLEQDAKREGLLTDRRLPAPVATRVPAREADTHPVPPGYGFRRLVGQELEDLPSFRHSVLAIWEYPRIRGHHRYVLGVDVGDGLGQDYSVISVIRLPTIEEVAEEVAQYVTNALPPSQLAFVTDAIGRYYHDEDGLEAQAAIELNNHGYGVQDLLQLHLGYTNFFIWEVVDAALPEARYTKRIGWVTSNRTRPMLLEKFHDAVTSIDPISGLADFRLNSPTTRGELRHFVTEGLLGDAEHAKGQHDDCIFASAIGYHVAWRLAGGEAEPIAERRRRRAQLVEIGKQGGKVRDWRNSAVTAGEADEGRDPDTAEFDDWSDDPASLYFDDRGRA